MKGTTTRFDRIDDMEATKTAFGTTYKLSSKTKTFDHNNPLISSRTNASNGYVALDDRYSRLVMEVKKVSSTMNYSSAKTTLIYVNAAGKVASHDYGDLSLDRRENFNLVFDLSPATLPDGCRGLISMTNNNWSSTLTLTLGDVTLDHGANDYSATLSGDYVEDDSYVQEYTADAHCTSLDMSQVSNLPATLPWLEVSNRVVFMSADTPIIASNVVADDQCQKLLLTTDGGNFRPVRSFQADGISFTTTVDGFRLLMLPFSAMIPNGAKAFIFGDDLSPVQMRSVPAHQPVLIEGEGELTFTGQGEVTFTKSPVGNKLRGSYTTIPLYTGDYVLAQQDGQWGFLRIEEPTMLSPFGVYATLDTQVPFLPLGQDPAGIVTATNSDIVPTVTYDLQGRIIPAAPLKPGLYIRSGKIIVVK